MEQGSDSSSATVLAHGPRPFADALPVCIYDCHNIWPSLHIGVSHSLSRFEWQWTSNGSIVGDSSSSVRLSFHLIQTSNLFHPATASAYWHLNPYGHVYLFPINSVESSEQCILVREFVRSCLNLSCQFLVICTTTGNELGSFKKSFDQLSTEITTLSRSPDRLIALPIKHSQLQTDASPSLESEFHSALLSYIGELVHASVRQRLNSYEQQSLHLWKTRSTSNWTFARFFAIKESLAFVFCHLGRRDLSVKQYESLYALLMSADYKRNPGQCFSDLPPAEAAQGVSNPECRDYRVKLLDGSISELDLHTFMFACQMALLHQERKYTQIAEKAVKLLSFVNRRCSELQHSLKTSSCPDVFRDIWMFTACRLISAILEPAIPQPIASNEVPRFRSSRERHTVRLLAGFHVHALKALQSLSKITLPKCLSPEIEVVCDRDVLSKEVMSTSNDKLRSALSTCAAAELLHSEIANAAASLYEMGYRSRGAAALDADAGRVHLRNGSYAEAESLLNVRCSAFMSNHSWDVLHQRERTDLANAENRLGRAQDYLLSCLTMLCMCRTSRSVDQPPQPLQDEPQQLRENAAFWFGEVTKTAKLLSRAMKYKADRLFFISVLPNTVPWEDGSAGSATVRIMSDIPALLLIDYVSAECKCFRATSVQKSALTRRQEQSLSDHGSATSSMRQSNSSPTSPSTSYNSLSSETVVLKSNPKITIAPGLNIIPVYTDEILHHGLYWISNVILYLGELKIVHVGPKPTSSMITSTQVGMGKPAISNSISSPLVDFAVFRAHTPFFSALKRVPSATVNVGAIQTLYFLPQVRQQISFTITAYERGIASGSVLNCHIMKPDGLNACNSLPIPKEGYLALSMMDQHAASTKFNVSSCADDALGTLGATIAEDVNNGGSLTAQISLDVKEFSPGNETDGSSANTTSENCRLHIALVWSELDGSTNRQFHCDVESKVFFIHPISIEGFVQFNAVHPTGSHWHNNVEQNVAADNSSPTILFFIRRHVTDTKILHISSIGLDLFSGHKCDGDLSLKALFPCTLSHNGTFVCAFTFPSKQMQRSRSYLVDETGGGPSNHLDGNGIATAAASDVVESRINLAAKDDFRNGNSTEHALSTATPARSIFISNAASQNSVSETGGLKIVSHDQDAIPELQSRSKRSEEEKDVDGSERMHLVLSNEYVTSSGGECSLRESESAAHNPWYVGTLKVQLEIQGTGKTVYERKVGISSLHHFSRFTVERKINYLGEVGKTLHMTVRVFNNNNSPQGDKELINLELDADPSAWLAIGRRGGKIRITEKEYNGSGESWNVELMAIKCGSHAVPEVNLFTTDGRKVSWDYDDASSNMNVLVLPSAPVVGACSGGEVWTTKEQIGTSEGVGLTHKWMPVVVESDSFFSRA